MESEKLFVHLPPHDRLALLEFRGDSLRVVFDDGRGRTVSAESIVSLSGGRIHNEVVAPDIPPALGRAYVGIHPRAFVQADAVPTSPADDVESKGSEEFSFVILLRVLDIPEAWFLVADSFNFRRTLGSDAGYSTETNLRTLMRRLVQFAPGAKQDKFFTAVLGNLPLPPPLNSLLEFLKTS